MEAVRSAGCGSAEYLIPQSWSDLLLPASLRQPVWSRCYCCSTQALSLLEVAVGRRKMQTEATLEMRYRASGMSMLNSTGLAPQVRKPEQMKMLPEVEELPSRAGCAPSSLDLGQR